MVSISIFILKKDDFGIDVCVLVIQVHSVVHFFFKGTVMQTEKSQISDRSHVSKLS